MKVGEGVPIGVGTRLTLTLLCGRSASSPPLCLTRAALGAHHGLVWPPGHNRQQMPQESATNLCAVPKRILCVHTFTH